MGDKDTHDYKIFKSKLILRHKELDIEPISILNSESILKFAEEVLHVDEFPEEVSFVVCLNANNKAINIFELSHGLTATTFIGIKEVMRRVLLSNAESFVLVHTHPGCSAEPSPEDLSLTESMYKAAKLLDLEFIDHIIIGHDSFISLRDLSKRAGKTW